jgi:hypothetical protein
LLLPVGDVPVVSYAFVDFVGVGRVIAQDDADARGVKSGDSAQLGHQEITVEVGILVADGIQGCPGCSWT